VTKLRDRKLKRRTELAVLRFTGPAVLIEPGFIANDADRAKLLDARTRDAVTTAFAMAPLTRFAGQ
jgi:N-acetylmuramoyl-L-alanine amidase